MVGMGSCGMDYLAAVATYPRPDDKLRTERLEVWRTHVLGGAAGVGRGLQASFDHTIHTPATSSNTESC